MASLLRALTQRSSERDLPLSLDEWASWFAYGGLQYPFIPGSGTLNQDREDIEASFRGYVQGAYKSNGVIFACMLARLLLFSEARFQFRRLQNGRPGELFGSRALESLETPWPGATTGDLLTRMIQDADLAGNFYGVRRGRAIRRLQPDWVTIVLGSETGSELDLDVIGYSYKPGGPSSGEKPVALLPEQVAHFAPIPDPAARFRGMSWLTPVVREILADSAATTHKLKFFENGATPNTVVSLDADITADKFTEWIETFESSYRGVLNAYKTLYLGGGADVKVIGTDLKQIDFKATQGAGETRIAAAAGVPPIVVGLSEGLESATYSNYGQARRRFADGTMRPLWRNAAGSLARLIEVPGGSELWYDDRDIPFLQEDMKDEAEIQSTQATAMNTLIMAGFKADSVRDAVTSGDLTRLEHSGLFSVQLHKPGSDNPPASADESAGRALRALLNGHTA